MNPRVWSWQQPLEGKPGELERLLRENWHNRVRIERFYRMRFPDVV